MAAALLLRGTDPMPVLSTGDQVAVRVTRDALTRAFELRENELDLLAQKIARALAGKG